jgi:hypothetical protein
LRWAISANYFDRVKLLVENGADVNRPSRGRTPYAEAAYGGHREIADYLVAKGGKRIAISLGTADEFAIACKRADAQRARELVASDPSLLGDAVGLLIWAAEAGPVNRHSIGKWLRSAIRIVRIVRLLRRGRRAAAVRGTIRIPCARRLWHAGLPTKRPRVARGWLPG